jgi:hypothetical protein
LDGYAAAEPAMNFTVGMMLARLLVGAIATLAGGAALGAIAPRGSRTVWVFAVLLLVVFVPEHAKLWHLFPVWYHLTFLLTLVPLTILGARLAQLRADAPEPSRST